MPSHAGLLSGAGPAHPHAHCHVPGAQDFSQGDKERIQMSPPCRTGCLELALLALQTQAGGEGGAEEPSPRSVLPPPTHNGVNIPWQTLQSKQGHPSPARLSSGLRAAPAKGTMTTFSRRAPSLARLLSAKGELTEPASPRNLGPEQPQGWWHSRLALKGVCGPF